MRWGRNPLLDSLCSSSLRIAAHICFADCTPQSIALAHKNNIKVMGWFPHPINNAIWSKYTEDAALYAQVAKSGVDIMCVNKPDLLREVLDELAQSM